MFYPFLAERPFHMSIFCTNKMLTIGETLPRSGSIVLNFLAFWLSVLPNCGLAMILHDISQRRFVKKWIEAFPAQYMPLWLNALVRQGVHWFLVNNKNRRRTDSQKESDGSITGPRVKTRGRCLHVPNVSNAWILCERVLLNILPIELKHQV